MAGKLAKVGSAQNAKYVKQIRILCNEKLFAAPYVISGVRRQTEDGVQRNRFDIILKSEVFF